MENYCWRKKSGEKTWSGMEVFGMLKESWRIIQINIWLKKTTLQKTFFLNFLDSSHSIGWSSRDFRKWCFIWNLFSIEENLFGKSSELESFHESLMSLTHVIHEVSKENFNEKHQKSFKTRAFNLHAPQCSVYDNFISRILFRLIYAQLCQPRNCWVR